MFKIQSQLTLRACLLLTLFIVSLNIARAGCAGSIKNSQVQGTAYKQYYRGSSQTRSWQSCRSACNKNAYCWRWQYVSARQNTVCSFFDDTATIKRNVCSTTQYCQASWTSGYCN
ncbi:hypothetical protein Ndes2526B_g02255 [Nannochloris sp. 'desiccata']